MVFNPWATKKGIEIEDRKMEKRKETNEDERKVD